MARRFPFTTIVTKDYAPGASPPGWKPKTARHGQRPRATLESDHRPDHSSAGHRGEGVLHLVKSDLARDHLIQTQRAVQIPPHEQREELGRDHVAAAARGEGDLLVEKTAPRER